MWRDYFLSKLINFLKLNIRYKRFLIIIPICFLLTNCATTDAITPHYNHYKAKSPYKLPAAKYLKEAHNANGQDKAKALVLAAGKLVEEGKWKEGTKILKQAKKFDAPIDETKIIQAKADLIQEKAQSAIENLSKVNSSIELSEYYKGEYHKLLANAYHLLGRKHESILERLKLNALTSDKESKISNSKSLWFTLASMPEAELNSILLEAVNDAALKGWIELSLIAKDKKNSGEKLLSSIGLWQKLYPYHEANLIIALNKNLALESLEQKHLALLLPLTGALEGPGNAIYDGFMAAHALDKNREHVSVKVYNTDSVNIESLYEHVVKQGATYVVGPLSKNNVVKVAALNHPIPTFFLNELTDASKNNTYQFGLSPTIEAKAVAKKAVEKGNYRTLIIAPNDKWGSEVVEAFKDEWMRSHGKIIDILKYDNNADLNFLIKEFLHVTESEKRNKQIKSLLGKKIEVVANRRQDFDMIFVLAYPSKGREIIPLLNYYYASNVPIYATSSIYAGNTNPLKDRDLNGVIFCDMPWVFKHQMTNKNWPEQYNSYNRLYALGMDSYALTDKFNKLLVFPGVENIDQSAVLYLSSNKQISRTLSWGQFKQGVPKIIS